MTKVFDKPKSKSFKFEPNSNLPKRPLVTSKDVLPNDKTAHRFPTIPTMPIQPRQKAPKKAHGNSSGKASAASTETGISDMPVSVYTHTNATFLPKPKAKEDEQANPVATVTSVNDLKTKVDGEPEKPELLMLKAKEDGKAKPLATVTSVNDLKTKVDSQPEKPKHPTPKA
jgi:hypothetical protein